MRGGIVDAVSTFCVLFRGARCAAGRLPRLCRRHSFEEHQAADIVDEVLKSDLDRGAHQADGAHQTAARSVLLGAEHMLDAGAHLALAPVRGGLCLGQRTIASPTFVNAAPEASCLQRPFRLGRAIGAVAVDLGASVALVQQIIELLAVVYTRVGNPVGADQLVPGIGVHVILVTEEAVPMLLRPTRILVLLAVLRRLLLPVLGRGAGLDLVILVTTVALPRHRHDRRVDQLATTGDVALGLEMLAKALEQLVDQARSGQLLAEQPQRRAVRDAALKAETEKARERKPVANLILDLLVG